MSKENYTPGTLASAILGDEPMKKVDDKLDSLFKSSAGASKTAAIPEPAFKSVLNEDKKSKSKKKAAKELQKKVQEVTEKSQELVTGKKRKAEEVESDNEEEQEAPRESRREKQKIEKEKEGRTVFVGNVPVACIEKPHAKALKRLFAEYGKIESIRFRSLALARPMPRKEGYITKSLNKERQVMNAYIVYKDKESSEKALELNGKVFLEKHLRVDHVAHPKEHDHKRSVFLGSLPLDAEEEELWEFFKACGDIESVRIIRDKETNLGKGIGYVQFMSRDAVALALALDDKPFRGKNPIRIKRCRIPGSEDNKNSKLTIPNKKKQPKVEAVKPEKKKQQQKTSSSNHVEGIRATKDLAAKFNAGKKRSSKNKAKHNKKQKRA